MSTLVQIIIVASAILGSIILHTIIHVVFKYAASRTANKVDDDIVSYW
jgi:hypothetical protein